LQAACATAGRGRTGLDSAHSFGLESTGLVQLKQVFPAIRQMNRGDPLGTVPGATFQNDQ